VTRLWLSSTPLDTPRPTPISTAAVAAAVGAAVGVCTAGNLAGAAASELVISAAQTANVAGFFEWLKTHAVAINDTVFHHVTVVIETISESGFQKFWSFEKLTHGIVIQCAMTRQELSVSDSKD
jgi:hypothetical protein